MKTEFITFRSVLPRATVRRLARGNISRWLNTLIQQQHAGHKSGGADWEAHLAWRDRQPRVFVGDKSDRKGER